MSGPYAFGVIPARGGSKGLPGKNLKRLGALSSDEAYQNYFEAAMGLVEVTGEESVRRAFFQGDKQASALLFRNIQRFKRLMEEQGQTPAEIIESHRRFEPLEASWF